MSQEPLQDLESRILALLDGTLDEKEVARLDAELRGSREARDLYQQLVLLHISLQEQATARSGIDKVPVIPIERLLARQRRRMVKTSLLAAAAVLVISTLGLWMKSVRSPDPMVRFQVGPDTAFILTHTGDDKAPMGNVLAEGSKLQLTLGTMEGVFGSGVRCVIEAPCDLTVLADDRISVAEGVAWFEVPSAAVGFTVETPQLTVVDLGTEFGVVARSRGSHEVHVIKGSVELASKPVSEGDAKQVLSARQARRADGSGGFVSIPVQAGRFTTALPKGVSIVNHSFEIDRNPHPQGDQTHGERRDFPAGELTAWIQHSPPATNIPDGAGVTVGWMDLEPSSLHPFPPVAGRPSQALSLQAGASVLNVTHSRWSDLQPGEKLTLTISLGDKARSSQSPSSVAAMHEWNEATFFGLTDGAADLSTVELSDTVANSGLIRNNPATGTQRGDGTLADLSFSHTVTEKDVQRPGRIGILIYSDTSGHRDTSNQAKFDHVRLTRTPPSPVPEG